MTENKSDSRYTGRLCNLKEIITTDDIHFADIIIPKIQRAYAQGRKREVNIREKFISQILECLYDGKDMELSFVYGSKKTVEDHSNFELLDGQQRITTIFLFYWYFIMAEGGRNAKVPEFMKHFSYETRATSTDFINKLVDSTIDVSDTKPSESICSKQWYTISFDKDSTVEGMLTTLDCIHEIYNKETEPSRMLANLDNIRFYELDLQDFGLTEEIYIKMNARGLQLTPFENFKADLVKYMKDEENSNYKDIVTMEIIGSPKVPYYLSFSQKLDSKWLNLFWSKNDTDSNTYCDKFFRFFYRYFSTKYFLEFKKDAGAQEFRPKRDWDWDFLWTSSQLQDSSREKIYLGFDIYRKLLNAYPDYINHIERILDTLCLPKIKALLDQALRAPWKDSERRCFFEEEYKLQYAVMFGAITEFIEAAQGNIIEEQLRRWIRVVWNTTENQLYQNVNEMVSTVRNLSEIINTDGATSDIYKVLSTFIEKKDFPRSLREEIKKAEIICKYDDKDWESAFIEAEKHIFFKGCIGFFLFEDIPATAQEFRHRTKILGSMFDAKGITPKFREHHVLMIAMMRQLNSPAKMGLRDDGSVNISITEGNDPLNHLKSLLIEKHAIQKMLCRVGDMPTSEDALNELHKINNCDIEFECDGDGQGVYDKITRAFKRLANDTRLYDFIEDSEDNTHILEFMFLDRWHYAINKKRSWYCKFFIESEKNFIIPDIIQLLGYELEDKNHEAAYKKYGDYFGYDVKMKKEIVEGKDLFINFYRGDRIDFLLFEPSEKILAQFESPEVREDGWSTLCQMYYSTKKDDFQEIVDKIKSVEDIIKSSFS